MSRIEAGIHFEEVIEAIFIRVLERGIAMIDPHFHAVVEAIAIRVGYERTGVVGVDFSAIAQAVAVGVIKDGVGVCGVQLLAVGEAIGIGVRAERIEAHVFEEIARGGERRIGIGPLGGVLHDDGLAFREVAVGVASQRW